MKRTMLLLVALICLLVAGCSMSKDDVIAVQKECADVGMKAKIGTFGFGALPARMYCSPDN